MEIFDLNNPDLYFLIALTAVNAVLLCFLSYKFLQIIQLSSYHLKSYGLWLKDTKAKWFGRIILLSFLSFCCVMTTNFLFNGIFNSKLFGYIGLVYYFSFSIIFIVQIHKIPQKKPLVITKRMIRLCIMLFLLFAALTFWLLVPLLSYSYYIRVSVIALTPITIPIMVAFATILVWPLERIIYNCYKHKCKKELQKHKDLIKIGITGSFGKTSTKMYLKSFLEKKYKVCATPSSFNTPMGISKVVFGELKDDDQIFVVEMGAKKVGDIKELCDMVNVDAGIITAVGEQHLDTFKNLQNIIKTKSELYNSLKDDAYCVFNCANENTKQMFDVCNLKNKISVLENDSFLFAKDIVATCDGLEFVLCYNGKEYPTHTEILGEHNIQNLLCAAALALKFGVTIKQILQVIQNLKPAEHRLELKRLDNDIIIIDDSFNSNIQGTAVALETLQLFEDRRKIVVTPGLVELGLREKVENQEFGKRIAKACNLVILVGKNQSDNIKKGLLEEGFDEKNIIMQESLFEVTNLFKTLLQPGDVVLLENDLPDNYK